MGLNGALRVRVTEARPVAEGVRALTLAALDGAPLPPYSPGSHVVVHLPGERVHRNPYSLAGQPWDTGAYRVAVRLVESGRGGSRYVHERLAEGDVLTIEPPRNLFAPVRTARRHVLVAGGIGITPFISYVHLLRRDGIPFELHYAVRDVAAAALLPELETLCGDALHVHVDTDGSAVLAALDERVLGVQPLGTHLSVCGPAPLMEAVLATARQHGWPPSRLHLERFGADIGSAEPFDVVLGRGGRRLHVPADRTLLETLEEAGLELPYACRQGVCGECRTGLLGGTPDHRDVFLTADARAAGDALMPCVSRCASGPLVLDLAE